MNDDKVNHRGDSWTVYESDKKLFMWLWWTGWVMTVENEIHSSCLPATCKLDYVSPGGYIKWVYCTVMWIHTVFFFFIYLHIRIPSIVSFRLSNNEYNSSLISTLTQWLTSSYLATLVDKPPLTDRHTKWHEQSNMFSVHSPHNQEIHLFLTVGRAYKLCLVKVSFSLDC